MKNILITGGAGFIGSHFIKQIHNDYNVVNIDKLTYCGTLKNLNKVNCCTYVEDIANNCIPDILNEKKIDTIVNFAANTHVDRSISNPREFLETDILGVFNLVYSSLKYKGIKRFIHIETDEVYGPIYEENEADENAILNPTSPYAASKASAGLLLSSYKKTYGLPLILIRPCNIYGTNQYPEKLIPFTITRLLESKPAILHGKGIEIREWMHSSDCVSMIRKIMEEGEIGEIYNLGSRIRKRNTDVIHAIIRKMYRLGFDLPTIPVEKIPNRPGNDFRYAINSSKVVKKFGHYITKKFPEGLEDIIKWYATHKDWYENINTSANIYKNNKDYLR